MGFGGSVLTGVKELPTGSYSRVASTFGYDTQTAGLDVVAGTNTHDITF